jgi:hypothetical protein
MIWYRKIVLLMMLILIAIGVPALLSLADATAQKITVYPGQIVDMSIEPIPGATYVWDIYCDATVNFASTSGNCSGSEYVFVDGNDKAHVQIFFNTPGEYFVKIEVWDPVLCTNNMKFAQIEVLDELPTALLKLDPEEICISEPSLLTVTLTGEPLWGFTLQAVDSDGNTDLFYYTDIDADKNPFTISVSPEKTTWYRVIEITDKNGIQSDPSNTVTLTVHPLPQNSRIYLK